MTVISHVTPLLVCLRMHVWHIFHQESPACSDVTAPPWSPTCFMCVCVYVCECLMSARWPLMTPTHRKWHMSALQPRVTNNLTFWGVIWHIQFWPWLLWSWTAETKRVLFHRRSPCSDGRGLKFECISICVSSLVFVDTWWHAASFLNACSSEELSLPEHWRAGQLHSLD